MELNKQLQKSNAISDLLYIQFFYILPFQHLLLNAKQTKSITSNQIQTQYKTGHNTENNVQTSDTSSDLSSLQ